MQKKEENEEAFRESENEMKMKREAISLK